MNKKRYILLRKQVAEVIRLKDELKDAERELKETEALIRKNEAHDDAVFKGATPIEGEGPK